jgi:hypothetical protein
MIRRMIHEQDSAVRRAVAHVTGRSVALALAGALAMFVSRTAQAQACSDGKVRNEDTAGHCCWEGQVWANNKCIGVPRACPSGWSPDPKKEGCSLNACANGMVRPPNGKTHCCWPGQAWSTLNGACVGNAKCPKGFEQRGDACVDLEAERAAQAKAAELAAAREHEAHELAERQKHEYEAEMRRQHELADQRAKQAAADQAEQARQTADAQRQAEERRAREAHEARVAEARSAALEKRDAGRVTLGFGVLCVGVSGLFMGLGAVTNGNIHNGGFKSASDIASEASRGRAFNYAAAGFGAAGGVLLVVALPIIFTHLPPKDSDVARAPSSTWSVGLGPSSASLRATF